MKISHTWDFLEQQYQCRPRLISFWVKTLYNFHPWIRAFIGGCQRARALVNTRPLAATNKSTNLRVDVE